MNNKIFSGLKAGVFALRKIFSSLNSFPPLKGSVFSSRANKKIIALGSFALIVASITIGFVIISENERKETMAQKFTQLSKGFRPSSNAAKRWAAVANYIDKNGITNKVDYSFDSKTANPGK